MNRKKALITVAIIAIILVAFGIIRITRHFQMKACIEKGGYWNYELNKCETIGSTLNIKDYYWHTVFDSIAQREYLERGRLTDSVSHSVAALIDILNKRPADCKIEYVSLNEDTLHIRILNDEALTEQMGTAGAHCYLGETVCTLTENDSVKLVNIALTEGSHAGPGTYGRNSFEDLVKD